MSTGLRGMTTRATERLLADLSFELERRVGTALEVVSDAHVEIARRVRAAEVADLVVLSADTVAALDAEGFLVPGSIRPLFESPVVVGVSASIPKPPLASEEDLIRLLLAARAIAISTGPSGAALMALIEMWGLGPELNQRIIQTSTGSPVAGLVASGQADVGIQQRSELAGVPGVSVVGPLPGNAAVTTTFSGAALRTSPDPFAAMNALTFLALPAVADYIEQHGMHQASAW
ncbi:substrate-binding domain-containing protein [Phycicoccus sp. CSK15P-2]|uniref:substrate-binding domain-containing protein n=1 Tax=Phycicoccus sp. CSK15P-2 TaxID=2807627 RepID=UPI00194E78D2|nr:substrate-binding domain-containing protein [Phycicoccus sp. CSK15P-2]MBM6403178.1 substrate-binding domain-containing protein [Phycicoccus sp. CSK15P-2]